MSDLPMPSDPDDDRFRAEFRRATATLPATGGDWSAVVRSSHRRHRQQVALRAGVPAVSVLLLAGGLWAAARRRTPERLAAATTTTASPAPPVPTTALGPSTSATPVVSTTPTSTTAIDPSTSVTPPETTTATTPTVTEPVTEPDPPTTPATTAPPTSTTAPPALGIHAALGLPLDGSGAPLRAVSDGTTAYVWAGDGTGVAVDPVTLATRSIAAMPIAARSWIWAGDRVFALGETTYATYDPRSDRWSAVVALPSPRHPTSSWALAVWNGSRVIIWEGSPTPGATDPTPTMLIGDLARGTWSTSSPAPSLRYGLLSAAAVGDTVVFNGDGTDLGRTAPFLVYRLSDDSWSEVTAPVQLPYTPYVTALGGRVLAIARDHTAAAAWDPATGAWTVSTPSMPRNFGQHSTFGLQSGGRLVYVSDSGALSVFDGSSWFDTVALAMPVPYDAVVAQGRVVIVGASTPSIADAASVVFTVPVDGLAPAAS